MAELPRLNGIIKALEEGGVAGKRIITRTPGAVNSRRTRGAAA